MSSFGHRGPSLLEPPAGRPSQTSLPTRLLSFEQATERVVATLQDQLPLGLWAVTRRDGDDQVFVEVSRTSTDTTTGALDTTTTSTMRPAGSSYDEIRAGTVVTWHGSMCQAMVDGAPPATADAAAVPAYAATRPVHDWPVRTYIAAPIATADGGLYGTLCGYGPQTGDPTELNRLEPVVDLLADLLGQVLLSQQLREHADDREAHLYRLATRDHLTGLATRSVLHERLTHALELHHAGSSAMGVPGELTGARPVTLLLIDVDDFKAVNDTHGHGTGDALLAHLGHEWATRIRPGDTLARIGGDEFALLIETGMTLDDVVAEITHGLGTPITVPGTTMCVTASVGLVHLDPGDPTPTAAELLARADRALYATKRGGKASLTIADDDRPRTR